MIPGPGLENAPHRRLDARHLLRVEGRVGVSLQAQSLAQETPLLRSQGRQRHEASVPRLVGVVTGRGAGQGAVLALHLRAGTPGRRLQHKVARHHEQGPVEHGDVDVTALPFPQHRDVGGEDGTQGRIAAARHVSHLSRRRQWSPAGLPADAEHAAKRQEVDVVGRIGNRRAGLSEARYGAVDEPGVQFPERFVVHPEAARHAGPEAFEHDVRRLRQAMQDLESRLGLEVQRDALLALVEEGRPGTHGPGLLDLEDLRPQGRQQPRAQRARVHVAQVQHFDAV